MSERTLSLALAGFFAVAALIGLVGWPAFPAEAIAGVFSWLMIGAAAAMLAFALRRAAAPAALSLGALLAAFAGLSRAPIATAEPAQGADLVILWANAFKRPEAAARAFALAREAGADALLFAELPDAAPNADYPYTAGLAIHDNSTITVYARRPILDWRYGETPGRLPAAFELALDDGRRITIACAHPTIPASPAQVATRAAQIEAAFALARGRRLAVVVGDFNAAPWNGALVRAARRADARRAPSGPTWLSRTPLLGLAIDHAFAIGDVRLSAEVLPAIGSDHFPVLVRIEAPPQVQP